MADTKRVPLWQDNLVTMSIPSGSQADESLLGDFSAQDSRGLTLVRTIIHLWAYPTTIGVVDGVQQIDAGIGTIEREAFIANVFPDPDTQGDFPGRGWVWRDEGPVFDNSAAEDFYSKPFEMKYDIRAMRKLYTSSLVLIVDNNPVAGTAFTVRVRGLIRCLYLQP